MQGRYPKMIGGFFRRWSGRSPQRSAQEIGPPPVQDPGVALALPFAAPPSSDDVLPRRAAVAHLFHAEMAGEFRSYFDAIPGSVDIFISTDHPDKERLITSAFDNWPKGKVEIRLVPNIGRDMAPKFVTFADVYDGYDVALFVHSKKSDYLDSGLDWRRYVLTSLCGSTETVRSILALLAPATGVGLVFPDHFPGILDLLEWGSNRALAGQLADRAGIPLARAHALDFVSGSMFWARPAALKPLLSLSLTYADFPPEAGQRDATLAHALERLLLYSTETAGLDWIKVADAGLHQGPASLVNVTDSSHLPAIIESVRRPLIRP